MKSFVASLVAFSALSVAGFAQLQIEFPVKVNEALMKEFDGMIWDVLMNPDLTDPDKTHQLSLAAKARVFKVGKEADIVFAALVVRGLAHTENQDPPVEWKSSRFLPHLVEVLRHSPSVEPYLTPALRQWLQYLADGKSGYRYGAMVEESAIYLLRWGGDQERPFLEKIAALLDARAKTDAGYLRLGEMIHRVLRGEGRNEIVPEIPFYQRCGNIVENARKSMEGTLYPKGTGTPEYEAQQKAKQQAKMAEPDGEPTGKGSSPAPSKSTAKSQPTVPNTARGQTSHGWLVWLLVVIAATVGVAWLLLRNRK